MPRLAPTAGMDAALNYYTDADDYRACAGAPTTYAAIATNAVNGALAPTFAALASYGGGRERQVNASNGIVTTAGGTIDHAALRKTADTTLRYVTTCTPVAVLIGQTINIGAWKIQIAN